MALIKCQNCGRDISDTTDKCIHCNYKINTNNENNNANANNALNLNNDNKKDNKYIKIKKSIFLTLIIIIVLLLVCLIATISFKNNDNLDIQEMDLVQIKPVQLKDDEIEYIYEVDMNSKLPSNLKPGVYIDLYFSAYASKLPTH